MNTSIQPKQDSLAMQIGIGIQMNKFKNKFDSQRKNINKNHILGIVYNQTK